MVDVDVAVSRSTSPVRRSNHWSVVVLAVVSRPVSSSTRRTWTAGTLWPATATSSRPTTDSVVCSAVPWPSSHEPVQLAPAAGAAGTSR